MILSIFATALSLAQAAPAPGAGASSPLGNPMIFMVLMFVLMYFLLIRPQRQRQKQHEQLLKSIRVGDHVVTSGGEHGIIASLREKTVMLKVADNVRIEYDRAAIAVVTRQTDKPEEAAPAADATDSKE